VIRIVIPGKPAPYGRARHHGRRHWHGEAHEAWQRKAVLHMVRALRTHAGIGEAPMGYHVTIRAYYPSQSARKAERGQLKRAAKSDLDNVAKLVLDSATKAKLWEDDRYVSVLVCERRWAEGKGLERVEVEVRAAGGEG
jgi:Holliday junction resolvase RusA-like endonuclease